MNSFDFLCTLCPNTLMHFLDVNVPAGQCLSPACHVLCCCGVSLFVFAETIHVGDIGQAKSTWVNSNLSNYSFFFFP